MAEIQGLLTLIVIICVVALLVIVLVRTDTSSGAAFRRSLGPSLRTRGAAVTMIGMVMSLLLLGIAHYGLVNSLPPERPVERSRQDVNRVKLTEDKDGCVDARTLGRSNGVYMSLKPCKDPEMQARLNQQKQPK